MNESTLGKVPDADLLDGRDSSDFLDRSEPPHSPTLESCDGIHDWAPAGIGLEPRFWKDSAGIVHDYVSLDGITYRAR